MLLRPSQSRRLLCTSAAFKGKWNLPFRQIPWALPFRQCQEEAINAFLVRHPSTPPRIELRAARPCLVPYYVFRGEMTVSFTGVALYDDNGDNDCHGRTPASDFVHKGIEVPTISLGADAGSVSAVYAGFEFRRFFLRQALAGGLSDELLESAVPRPLLQDVPAGVHEEAFQMKPSFAYQNRIVERLSEIAHHQAECRMEAEEVRSLQFEARDGRSKRPSEFVPDFERVAEVHYELENPRLHDKGVVALPVWAIEYTCLGKSYRAFVSALRPGPSPAVASMQHHSPWASAAAPWETTTGDATRDWKVVGELRRLDAEANTDWKVQRFWQNEVARVMPDFQKPESRARNWGFKSFLPGGGAVSDEDYELLGLPTTPLPTSVEVRKAFRMQAMAWHPDLQQSKSAAEQAECSERFQRIGEAYKRLQARHPEYLDQQATRSRS